MTKYLLSFLLFVSVGLSQGKAAGDIDRVLRNLANHTTSTRLANVLQGASSKHIKTVVVNASGNIDKSLMVSIETKLKLGMKRNKLSHVGFDIAKWSEIVIEVSETVTEGKVAGYKWRASIRRYVRTADGKNKIKIPAEWLIDTGVQRSSARLKGDIEGILSQIFLAYQAKDIAEDLLKE